MKLQFELQINAEWTIVFVYLFTNNLASLYLGLIQLHEFKEKGTQSWQDEQRSSALWSQSQQEFQDPRHP